MWRIGVFLAALSATAVAAAGAEPADLTWASPSEDSFGSMPLGNGDVGLNVWVEKTGDLVFYISKVDAYDAGHMLRKLGRVRVRLAPAMPVDKFRQTLVLREGAIRIAGGDVSLRVWVDANHPVIRVEGTSQAPRTATISLEPLRRLAHVADVNAAKLPGSGTAGILLDDKADRLVWCYRNMSSAWADRLRQQNSPAMVAKADDPILLRTSGCRLEAAGFTRTAADALTTKTAATGFDCSIRVLSTRTATPAEWFAEVAKPVESDWTQHVAWWAEFWGRSHITVTRCGDGPVRLDQCRYTQFPQGSLAYMGHREIDGRQNARQLTERYALERFAEACAGRGAVPPPYNGSIFTMDMPAGALGFNAPKRKPTSADDRDWGNLSFMWQNTRHPYWAMPARGDDDTILPGLRFVRDGLDICRDRCQNIFHHDGAFIMEASWWHNVGVFSWPHVPGHLRYHFLATIETPALMCDYYEHTCDRQFLKDILLPCADEFIKFYELQFPRRDARGKLLMEPAATVETYQPVTNPCTEICGLRHVLAKLIALDEGLIGPERKKHWTKLLGEMPDVPLRRIKGLDLLAVGEKYAPGREICESPEMYSVYPFRQAWLGNDRLLAAARQSFHIRTVSLDGTADGQAVETGGWQAAPVQAAYLGLAREAARLTSINFHDQFIHWTDNVDPNALFPKRPRARFPAFWETKMDYTPDNDHGANSANALQSMLLQSDGRHIFLLPAWPENWDVSFKLHAAGNTTVECVYNGGKVESLKVTPPSRASDVRDMTSLAARVRTLVSVACADRNYLFDLPPMLDGLAAPGDAGRLKTTGPWLASYGSTLYDTRGGPFPMQPWGGCVYRGNVAYLHVLDWPTGNIELPPLARALRSSQCLTGAEIRAEQRPQGIVIRRVTKKADWPDTIIRLEFDGPLDEIALSMPSQGSLTAGKRRSGNEIDLGRPTTFDRIEFTIDNPNHRRGQAKPFTLQAKQPDGSWRTIHQGRVFGSIYSKRFDPVTAQSVRLEIDAPRVRQFDLFGDENLSR